MNRHLLVTVSGQLTALHGVRFVSGFFSNKEKMQLTLFYIAPKTMESDNGMPDFETKNNIEQQKKLQEERGRAALEQAKSLALESGFKPGRVETKFTFHKRNKVDDILYEAEKGLYDAAVLGRRGVSRLEEAMGESVSKNILEQSMGLPLWICRHPEADRRNVLICVDGSDSSHRVLDHAGFILAEEPRHEITLLRVERPGRDEFEENEAIFAKCKSILAENDFPEERVKTKVLQGSNVSKIILETARTERFAAVATGRTGKGKGFLDKLFMGSVSSALFRQLSGAALWVCN